MGVEFFPLNRILFRLRLNHYLDGKEDPMTSAIRKSSFDPGGPIAGLTAGAAAAVAGVSLSAIQARPRCRRPVFRARQLAIYLHHVAMGATVAACARQFDRDRATIRLAIRRIEDLRENRAFDCGAARLEQAVATLHDMVLELLAEAKGAAR